MNFLQLICLIVALSILPLAHLQKHHGLKIGTITEGKIEGEYRGLNGAGIHFVSEQTDDGERKLSLTTMEGDSLLSMQSLNSKKKAAIMSINSASFLVLRKEQRGYIDFSISNQDVNDVQTALSQKTLTRGILRKLDYKSANKTRQEAIENLVLRPEADLIVSAAHALGELGVQGSEYQAALPLYAFAMQVVKTRDKISVQVFEQETEQYNDDFNHDQIFSVKQDTVCADGNTCSTGSCPYRGDQDNECSGMCGKGCQCWSIVCGDCCVHKGCKEHDDCCEENGYWSWSCLDVLSFDCENYAYKCNP